jgi:hypothetical protein
MSGYIGTAPVPQATQTRDSFTATSGQTSFATGGYTPLYLDLFMNGVHLVNGTDYTATNGSDVVLASGAATGDILEVVAYTAFDTANVTGATNFTVTGAFTSQGIDDNGNATALTIDSSENVLVGKTSSGFANTGHQLNGGGSYAAFTRDGGTPVLVNRKTNDGTLVEYMKDGTTVGYVGTYGGDLTVGTGDTGVRFIDSLDCIVPISDAAGTSRDAAVDLGYSSIRYKDAYLSGGIYLGGTGSANKLDSYEEGTFTPTVLYGGSDTGQSYSIRTSRYTRVGRVVYYSAYIQVNSNSSATGTLSVGGLPFTSATGSNLNWLGSASLDNASSNIDQPVGRITAGTTQVLIMTGNNTNNWAVHTNTIRGSAFRVFVAGHYEVN